MKSESKRNSIQKMLFIALLITSLSSSAFLNGQAKQLQEDGFDVAYLSAETAEQLMPDHKFLDHIFEHFIGTFRLN